MERRRESRFALNRPVELALLGEAEVCLTARIADASGHGIKLLSTAAVAASSAVKIRIDDALILGEVCYCSPDGPGFAIGIAIEQVLTGLQDLARLRTQLVASSNHPKSLQIAGS